MAHALSERVVLPKHINHTTTTRLDPSNPKSCKALYYVLLEKSRGSAIRPLTLSPIALKGRNCPRTQSYFHHEIYRIPRHCAFSRLFVIASRLYPSYLSMSIQVFDSTSVTQILYLNVPPEQKLDQKHTDAGSQWSKVLDLITAFKGLLRLYWGRRLEEPEKVQLHLSRL